MVNDKYNAQLQRIKREILETIKLYVEEILKKDAVLRDPINSVLGYTILEVSSQGVWVQDNQGSKWMEESDTLPVEELLKLLKIIEKEELK